MANSRSNPADRQATAGRPTVRTASAGDIDTLATTLASAFADDPLMLWMLGDVADPERRLRHAFAAMARRGVRVRGHHVALTEDGASAAMWADIDHWRSPASRWLRSLPAIIRSFRGGTLKLLRSYAHVERHHPAGPHYFLEVLGTHAQHQGRGLGSEALGPMLARCDLEGVPAYTESSNPKNLPFYFRHGFVQRGEELRIDDSPPVFPLWREPR